MCIQCTPLVYLEPVDGAAVDEGGEHAEPVAERVPDGTEGEDEVKVGANALQELVVHVEWREFELGALQQRDDLHLNTTTQRLLSIKKVKE